MSNTNLQYAHLL